MNVTQIDAVKRFLGSKTRPDLASLYSADMEVQVIVGQDGGERINKTYNGHTWTGYTDGIQTWKPFRIPRNARTEPEYDLSTTMSFDLEKHAEGIGMTGWDWKNRCSKWVAFDFDAMTGHSENHVKRLTNQELQNIKSIVSNVPWVTIRKSTGGQGLHLYVFVDNVPTANHTEHAALARGIIGKLIAITGYDFESRVDICGSNMWVWHRKMLGTDGLELIKEGEVLTDIPPNWRDHLCVVSGKRKRSVPGFISDKSSEVEKLYDELSGQRNKVALDEEHKDLIKFLETNGCYWSYNQDDSMLIAHTFDLKQAHSELGMRGVFETIAQGSERGTDKNCFLYPLRNGGWAVRRYSPGVAEAPTWEQDGQGWTRCFLNVEADLKTAARRYGGREDTDGSFHFREVSMAAEAMQMLGINVPYSRSLSMSQANLKTLKDGKILFSIDFDPDKSLDSAMDDWLKKKGRLNKIFKPKISNQSNEIEVGNFDEIIRHLVTSNNENYGWTLKDDNGWRREPLEHIKIFLGTLGLDSKAIATALGSAISKCWTVVNKPFQPEYPGNREWNKDGAQLLFNPTINTDNLKYPNWTKVLEHCGQGLNEAISHDAWCKANGILNGADYLKCWIAALVQKPSEPLPYLFFYSYEENTGKSSFHEAISLLMSTNAVVRADYALTNNNGFNAEIEHAILCIIEETSLQQNRTAYNRIKDWVTARTISLHRKGSTPYTITNTTHWVQCSNDPSYCPIFSGDTRITMINVKPFEDVTDIIPKRELLEKLEYEAPDFLAELITLELPKPTSRLSLPIIVTSEKQAAADRNKDVLELFLEQECYKVDGSMVNYGELYDKFRSWMDPNEQYKWTKTKFGKEIVRYYPKGRDPKNGQFCIGNISMVKPISNQKLPRLVCYEDKLVPYANK